jgi:pyruvate formate lyase activating enzyme
LDRLRRSNCVACGRCVDRCPQGARNICGWETDVPTLVERLLRQRDLFELSGGGVTLTGGEPLFQPEFAVELARALRREQIHVALETCGFASPNVFDALTAEVDLVYFDVKILDPARSRRWIGVDSAPILANLRRLCASGRPFVVRTPLIPGVNDSAEERAAVERLVDGVPSALGVEFLPYNVAAGAKYALLDRDFDPDLP